MTTHDAASDFSDELRSTIHDFMQYIHTDDGLGAATDLLRQARAQLAGPPAPHYYERSFDAAGDHQSAFLDYLDQTPFGGGDNPISPPGSIELHVDADEPHVTGRVTAGRPYEGPAKCLHGGYVAGLFDHFLGMAQHAYNQGRGTSVMAATRALTVRFLKPTPLDTELTFRASMEDVDERTLRGSATCHAGGVLTATAEGEFAKIDRTRILSTDPGGFHKAQ